MLTWYYEATHIQTTLVGLRRKERRRRKGIEREFCSRYFPFPWRLKHAEEHVQYANMCDTVLLYLFVIKLQMKHYLIKALWWREIIWCHKVLVGFQDILSHLKISTLVVINLIGNKNWDTTIILFNTAQFLSGVISNALRINTLVFCNNWKVLFTASSWF